MCLTTKRLMKIRALIYRTISFSPGLKKIAQRTITIINRLKYFKNKQTFSINTIESIIYKEEESFFGYYDYLPVNESFTKVIFHSSPSPTYKKPTIGNKIKIIEKDLITNKCKIIDETSSFNWQQGSRLQWIDNNRYIYNKYCDKNLSFYSCKYDNKNKKYETYDLPIQSGFKNKYFLSIDYSILNSYRTDYSYKQETCQKLDGIWITFYKTKKYEQVLTFDQIFSFQNNNTSMYNWINHLMISPKGDSFIFLHRRLIKKQKSERILLYSFKKKKLIALTDFWIVSHFNWIDNNNLIVFMGVNKDDLSYKTISIDNNQIHEKKYFNEFNNLDGHPSKSNNVLITDTYPDKSGFQRILLKEKGVFYTKEILRVYHPLRYFKDSRCDLHPRIYSNTVFFDYIKKNRRQLAMMKLNG